MFEHRGSCPHRYSDAETADVILRLQSSSSSLSWLPDRGCAGENFATSLQEKEDSHTLHDAVVDGRGKGAGSVEVLYVHSQVLRRSEYFSARLSERWETEKMFHETRKKGCIELPTILCKNTHIYKRCIELMYGLDLKTASYNAFASVQDALDILEVAAQLLFHDCMRACLCYLEAVPWSHEEEMAVRSCSVLSLHVQIAPDLGVRLRTHPDSKPSEMMKDVLGELLSLVSNGAPSRAREVTERVLQGNVEPCVSSAFAAVNETALSKELHNNLDVLKSQLKKFANLFSWNSHQVHVASSALKWLLEEFFVLHIADVAIRIFAEEQDLAQLMVTRIFQNPFTETLFIILKRMLHALESGEVIVPRTVRLALVTIWLPVIARLANDSDEVKDNDVQEVLEKSLCSVVGTLPVVDQQEIFKTWIATCLKTRKAWPDLSAAFDSWCSKLRNAELEREHKQGAAETNKD